MLMRGRRDDDRTKEGGDGGHIDRSWRPCNVVL